MKYFSGPSTDTYNTEPKGSASNMQNPPTERSLNRVQVNRYVSGIVICLCSAVFSMPCTLAWNVFLGTLSSESNETLIFIYVYNFL